MEEKESMVYIPNQEKRAADTKRELSTGEYLELQIARYRELDPVDSPLEGVVFRYLPEDMANSTGKLDYYIRQLNQSLYEELRGRRYLFFQGTGNSFSLRISYCTEPPPLPELTRLVQSIVQTGREIDAAMRAAAFSH